MARQYEVRFDRTRQRKGLKPWAVFEKVEDNFSRGLSQHATEAEAKAAMAAREHEARAGTSF